MFDPTPNQLPLQPYSDAADSRPLPEIIADGNSDPETGWDAFPLAYHDVKGVRFYAVQDWISGVAQTENPRNFWNMLKKRLKSGFSSWELNCRHGVYSWPTVRAMVKSTRSTTPPLKGCIALPNGWV